MAKETKPRAFAAGMGTALCLSSRLNQTPARDSPVDLFDERQRGC
jgi:hypothetical protein